MEKKVKTKISYYGIIALIAAIGAIAYIPMLNNGFTWYSDNVYVLQNEQLRDLNAESFSLFFSSYFDGHYHPLVMLSFALNYAVHGTDATGYQVTNLLLFIACIIMLYLI